MPVRRPRSSNPAPAMKGAAALRNPPMVHSSDGLPPPASEPDVRRGGCRTFGCYRRSHCIGPPPIPGASEGSLQAIQEALEVRPVIAARAPAEVAHQAIEQPHEPEDLL
jgi:hypothetical protein